MIEMQQKEIEFLKASLLENKSEPEISKIEKDYQKRLFQLQKEYTDIQSHSSQLESGKLLEIKKPNEPSTKLMKEKETILKVKSKPNSPLTQSQ